MTKNITFQLWLYETKTKREEKKEKDYQPSYQLVTNFDSE